MGTHHAHTLHGFSGVKIVAAVDNDFLKARKLAEEYDIELVTAHYEEILQRDDIDAVIVSLPSHIRVEMVAQALNKGKHVFVEKPMALTLSDADKMISASKTSGAILVSGQVMRFTKIHRHLRAMIKKNELGEIQQVIRWGIYLIEDPYVPWWNDPAVRDGFVIHHHGSHSIDLIIWLLDIRISSVFAVCKHPPGHLYEDTASILMKSVDGVPISIHESFSSRRRHSGLLIIGSEATAECAFPSKPNQKLYVDGEVVLDVDETEWFNLQMSSFLESIEQRTQPKEAGAETIRHSIAVVEAAIKSCKSGRAVKLAT
jgi:predicted dehydrogenase